MKRRRKNPRDGLTTLIVVAAVGGAGYFAYQLWRTANNPANLTVPSVKVGDSTNSRNNQGGLGPVGGLGY